MSRCFKIVVGAWAGLLLMGGVALIAEKQEHAAADCDGAHRATRQGAGDQSRGTGKTG